MKKILLIISGIAFLFFCPNFGSPIEIRSLTVDRIVTTLFYLFAAVLTVILFKEVFGLKKKFVRNSLFIVLVLVSLLYLWNGFWLLIFTYDKGPVWEDRQVYTNLKGDKVISQFMEISGSMYDYRERLIFYEFRNGDRISIDWSKDKMQGIWKVYDVKKDSSYDKNFDM